MNDTDQLVDMASLELQRNGLLSLTTINKLLDAGIDPESIS